MCNSLATHKPQNAAAIVGDVIEVTDHGYTVQLVSLGNDGVEYKEPIPVYDPNHKFKLGDKLDIVGSLVMVDRQTKLAPSKVTKVPKKTGYENYAQILGRMAMKEAWAGNADKKPAGWCLLETAQNMLVRSAFFRPFIPLMLDDNKSPVDSIVKIGGALRNREFFNETTGESERRLEINALRRAVYKGAKVFAGIQILQRPVITDPFMAYTAPAEQVIETGSTRNSGDDDIPI